MAFFSDMDGKNFLKEGKIWGSHDKLLIGILSNIGNHIKHKEMLT